MLLEIRVKSLVYFANISSSFILSLHFYKYMLLTYQTSYHLKTKTIPRYSDVYIYSTCYVIFTNKNFWNFEHFHPHINHWNCMHIVTTNHFKTI